MKTNTYSTLQHVHTLSHSLVNHIINKYFRYRYQHQRHNYKFTYSDRNLEKGEGLHDKSMIGEIL